MTSELPGREVAQLWHAASLYYDLLLDPMAESELTKTVAEWTEECGRIDDFWKQPLFRFSAHIDSCAIRLYSIDEESNSPRYQKYMDWWVDSSKAAANFTKENTHLVIHCVIRNIVAHHEEKEPKNPSYEILKAYYDGLTFAEILEGIRTLVRTMAAELNLQSFA